MLELNVEKRPLFSIVLLNWNAKKHLEQCLKSIFQTDYPNKEIIIVDNASQDGSIEYINKVFKDSNFYVIRNNDNFGPAYALNQGIKKSHGKYISFLASDTKVDSKCFTEIANVMEKDEKIGACESKLLLMGNPKFFDHAGEYLTKFGFLYNRIAGNEEDKGQFNKVEEIFSVKGTALTVRSDAIKKSGLHDEDYFMYLEETDLCWRIWLSGYKIVFIPTAIIFHDTGTSTKILKSEQRNYLSKYYGARNYITTLMKNLEIKNLAKILPIHIFLWVGMALYFTIQKRPIEGWYIMKGILSNVLNFLHIFKKRQQIQRQRLVTDAQIFPHIIKNQHFSHFYNRIRGW